MSQSVEKTTTKSVRKPRFGFTIKKDILVLRAALSKNPWQTGHSKWETVRDVVQKAYGESITIRTIKNRVDLLLDQYRSQQLQCKSGTEEEKSKRGQLLESIDSIIQEESAAINIELSADNDELSDNEESAAVTDEVVNESIKVTKTVSDAAQTETETPPQVLSQQSSQHDVSPTTIDAADEQPDAVSKKLKTKKIRQQRLDEREKADKERDALLSLADEPATQPKKARLSLEEEIILKRQEHDMKMECERLEIERQRERRLEEEGRRRDELSMNQLCIQNSMVAVITKLMERNS